MNPNQNQPVPPEKGMRLPVVAAVAVALAVVGGVAYWAANRSKPNTSTAHDQISAAQPDQTTVSLPTPPPRPPPPPPPPSEPPPNPGQAETNRIAIPRPPGQQAGSSLPVASPYTRQLISNLSEFRVENGAITAEQATAWRDAFQKLTKEGAAAVPAIRAYLDQNVDLKFDSIEGGDQMGYPSLRLALLDALRQIGGPEGLTGSLDTLRNTADPQEIAMLARNLEELEPGQHRSAVLESVRASLNMAANQQLEGRDVNPLFEVLHHYGEMSDLENAVQRWHYYATIALAQVPDGQGVETLVRIAQPESGIRSSARAAAFSMLAQLSSSSPQARQALIDQAKNKGIPNVAWPELSAALAGNEYQFRNQFFQSSTPPPSDPSKLKDYHIAFGNQNYYAYNTADQWTPDQVKDRLSLIDQVIAANPDPAGLSYLQAARAQVAALVQK